MTDPGRIFEQFVHIVKTLRSDKGCPWDRDQSPQSLKRYLAEETRELLEAIDTGDQQHIKEELGDLLYLVVLMAQIHDEDDRFSITDVIESVSAKMVRRHPHVFSDQKTGSAAELRRSWLAIKKKEKSERSQSKKN